MFRLSATKARTKELPGRCTIGQRRTEATGTSDAINKTELGNFARRLHKNSGSAAGTKSSLLQRIRCLRLVV